MQRFGRPGPNSTGSTGTASSAWSCSALRPGEAATEECDVDVLVVLRGPFALYPEIKRVARVQIDLLLRHEHEEIVSLVLVPEERVADPQSSHS